MSIVLSFVILLSVFHLIVVLLSVMAPMKCKSMLENRNCLEDKIISWYLFQIQVYHPNIDLEGNVCLNILREDWKPVLTINAIVYGLQYLFLEPNPDDPLNKEAANELQVIEINDREFREN